MEKGGRTLLTFGPFSNLTSPGVLTLMHLPRRRPHHPHRAIDDRPPVGVLFSACCRLGFFREASTMSTPSTGPARDNLRHGITYRLGESPPSSARSCGVEHEAVRATPRSKGRALLAPVAPGVDAPHRWWG
jgi:hypothetical protein